MIRRLAAAALTLTALLSLTACGGDADASSSKGQVTLTIGDQAKTLQTIAAASGALKGADYKVKWAEFEGAAPLFQAVQAGAADTTYAADLPTLQALSGGVKFKNVAALKNDGRHVGIVVRKDSGITRVADLKGQKVVVSSAKGSIAEYLLANALQQAGLTYSDVQVQYLLPTDAQAAFASGKIKAWAIFGVYQAVALDQGGKLIVDGADGRVSGYGFIGAAEKTLADPAKKAALGDFLKRLGTALTWTSTHQDAYARAIQDRNGADAAVARTLASAAYSQVLPVTPEIDRTVQGVADLMNGIGVLKPNVEVASAADTSVLK
ncbi:ABC transporter substrate-binding protein [Streptomyces acidiscabies]|uniref:Putative aliphatic sulfonates-binding protein n=1 Tax=Streptomyces acidiscabies TaxID=42234 RepID=A0AAP6BAT7_9ACTN|nr:ABC transporter substrate-binding protein [Streptomyces acidiscabies]MBP5935100.1 ABC transporter substrate-binding protein [Streptomyces sp. LBUM 1476]MBZ3917108.1 ABC transporter substrate-binding protein [Streptomyces acidiscabies]MDX2961348.1 ABC transporter substrate-binding protein [Streptomyces acidiscabies]MDX3022706.1 ABC transporter substrate-binding protein [Streptomyces acidiscabies]MDX3792070.1 ABC transporter substrate-binding protein [Streptomyces acidiscabies]